MGDMSCLDGHGDAVVDIGHAVGVDVGFGGGRAVIFKVEIRSVVGACIANFFARWL